MILQCGNRNLNLETPQVMGILNVTPDSFSDGGRFSDLDKALYHAEQMLAEGAAIIDVGGESTRPGAQSVTVSQELERVIPVVEAIGRRLDVLISVDTSSPQVIVAAASAGAHIINDVRSLTREGALAAAAYRDLTACVMHMNAEPEARQKKPQYSHAMKLAV